MRKGFRSLLPQESHGFGVALFGALAGVLLSSCTAKLNAPVAWDELSIAKILTPSGMSLSPATQVLSPGATLSFSASGGTEPYTYELYYGEGAVDSASGLYTAPSLPGDAVIRAVDASGKAAYAGILITDAPVIRPASLSLGAGNRFAFSVASGKAPYQFAIVSGGGSISATEGRYTAPASPGSVTVRVTDAKGRSSDATVTVNAALAISPKTMSVPLSSSQVFSATGGVGAVTYTLLSGSGSIDPTSGAYLAPASVGTAVIKAEDELGNLDTAVVTIANPLRISPATLTIAKNTSFSFGAMGGKPPYSFSVPAPADGSIALGTGAYTAPSSTGLATVVVTDADSQTATAVVTVTQALSFSSPSVTLMVGDAYTFSATGGSTPYVFTVPPTGFTLSSGSTYTTTTPGTYAIGVIDSQAPTANSATATVVVNPALTISPATLELGGGNSFGFSATGGIPPYTFSSTSGTIDAASGAFTAPASAGPITVTVTDSAAHTVQATVTMNAALSLTPASATLSALGSQAFSATGGVPPYTYSVISGGGAINSTSGVYTAPSTSGLAAVRVQDSFGNTAESALAIVDALKIIPSTVSLMKGSGIVLMASGGVGPYTFSLASGSGSVDSVTGAFTAPSSAGTARVRVTDALSNSVEATLTIYDGLTISPFTQTMVVGQTTSFTATGGISPYSYSLVSGDGSISALTGAYTAGSTSGLATVRVSDAQGNTSDATITVNAALAISPLTKNLAITNPASFTATGGIAPYSFAIVSGGAGGTIQASTGDYTAPASVGSGTTTVRVTDSAGSTSDATVTINAALSISPATPSVQTSATQAFSSAGGVGTKTYSLVSGTGSVNASSGVYTAGASPGSAVIRVTDSLGNYAETTTQVHAPLSLTPSSATLGVNNSASFLASGGVLPYTFSKPAGLGTLTAAGVYTAAATPGSATVRVRDALNITVDATVTVNAALTLSPATKTLQVNETQTFTPSGGVGPYTFSVVGGSGSVSGAGLFTAPAAAASAFVRVTDSLGNTADASVTIQPALSITPTSKTLAINNTFTFSSSGGVGSYTYSVTSGTGTGTIHASSGLYTAPGLSGSATVQVADTAGHTAQATITINSALALGPTSATVALNATRTFSASGGVGPYTYSVTSGAGTGSVNASSGVYTAPSSAGTATVRATDALGNTADASITIYGPLSISPSSKTLAVGDPQTFTASGGVSPYTYSVVSGGGGSINASTGAYSAPGSAGAYTVRVTDSASPTPNTADAAVTVNAALAISPTTKTLAVNDTASFTATGGIAPYTYAVVSGGVGSIDSSTGAYTAPASTGSATVRVTDSASHTTDATITVNAALAISPTTKTLVVNGSASFSASGGVLPYTYSVVSGGGSIDSSTGAYTAPNSSGSATIRVTDSASHTANASVTINAALTISPTSKTLAVNNLASFTASGGIPPYTFSKSAGTGTVTSSGDYTAPASSGTATITVSDSQSPTPNTASASVTINPALAISPSSVSLATGGTQTFSTTGGAGTVTYSVTGLGSIDSATGAYTAASTGGKATVTAADALGNTSSATVAIKPSLSIAATESANEGSSITFTVTQSATSAQNVSFDYAASGGTATSGTDYTATSGTATITAGATSVNLTVPTTLRSSYYQGDRTFNLTLSNATNATISLASTGVGTIVETSPHISSISPTAGGAGTTITISGSNFVSGATATLGGVACTSPTFNSSSSLSCVTPAGVGTATLVVTHPDGQTATLASAFTYPAGDVYWDQVVSLLHFDGANGSTAFTDEKGLTWNLFGSGQQISTTRSKFGGASGYFTGAAQMDINTPGAPFQLGSADFTVEAWVYPTGAQNALAVIVGNYAATGSTNRGWELGFANSALNSGAGLGFIYSTSGTDTVSCAYDNSWTTNTWYHVAASRNGSNLRLFIDGSLVKTCTITGSIYASTKTMKIGGWDEDGNYNLGLLGYLDEVRVTKGVSRYNAAFTKPASPFASVAAPVITSISPSNGPAGTVVTIIGNLFANDTTASVGGTPCTTTTFVNSATLTCVVPTGSGSQDVAIQNSDGQTATLTGGFTYGTYWKLSYAGTDLPFVVPAGCTSLQVKAWGGGGGAANYNSTNNLGGAGGFTQGTLSVTPGETLTVKVGGGALGGAYGNGGSGSNGIGAGGGGRSAIRRSSTELLTAGAGGGGAYVSAGNSIGHGGAGGQTGAAGSNGGGAGGTQSAGGAGSAAGTQFQGGNSASGLGWGTSSGGWPNGGNGGHNPGVNCGGGGGDGYYGGGASASCGGGGGGASYASGVNLTFVSGSGATAPNQADEDYVTGIAAGGNASTNQGKGGDGQVILKCVDNPTVSSVLLLHLNGANGSTAFTDEIGHTLTPDGSPVISTAQSKFGGASAYFNGSSGLTFMPGDGSLNFGTGDWTLDFWIYPVSNASPAIPYSYGSYVTETWFYAQMTSTFWWRNLSGNVGGGAGITGSNFPAGSWSHYAAQSKAGTITAYLNGVSQGTYNASSLSWNTSCGLKIGHGTSSGCTNDYYFNGYIDEVRVVKGSALYNGNFTPPTQAYW